MPAFACPGLTLALQEHIDAIEVEDEIDGERDANDAWDQLRVDDILSVQDQLGSGTPTLEKVLEKASKVVTDATDQDYRRCDELRLDGTTNPPREYRASYSQAMKMRAAITYGESWAGWRGNPSVSTQVSRYMVSLKRRKVRNGETAMSSRAITADLLKAMWIYNHRPDNWDIKLYEPGSRDNQNIHHWGGGRARRLLHCAYTIAFWCLLRFDEVLQIQIHEFELVSPTCLKITLPFRKTHQNGCIKPFYLHLLHPSEAHLCPVRAFAEWYFVNGRRLQYGYVFRERRWSLRKLCDWGGWSTNFTSLTIIKYLISWNDDPLEPREDFLNPNRAPAVRCPQCGRSCHCA
ncbi:uncharacterized protein LAESUDRAFT_735999 [Laetiporus sulphureus 93-53]|uniref:Uncharacterized protein n=1 Tax=Laetiporus sulphureus 93-53 TaxID=1314785 RepID=A0A165F6H4_9APHY|nr:uncharacterized protein LAESUDRAFT_735999 [Laetiporus sulphureus 93-53]KZT08486.1 hypothetical protein LAESUDRAFT_735999 [Laetiporus sulphureus 93-53]